MNATAGFQRLAFRRIADVHAKALAVAQVGFDLFAQPGMVDHQVSKACGRQRAYVIFDQGYAIGAHQRLGRMQRQRAQALTLARRENHRLHALTCGNSCSNARNSASSGRRAVTLSM